MSTELRLDPRTTALVLIDLQQGIVGRTLAPYDSAHVVETAARLGRRWNEKGALIVAVNVAFASDGGDRLQQAVDAPAALPPGGIPASWSDLVPEIAALRAGVAITKHQWGAFHDTGLDTQLRRRGIDTIVVCGIATNFGVESTAREGWQHNYSVVIAEDACSTMEAEMHRLAIEKILPRVAHVRSTAEILSALA